MHNSDHVIVDVEAIGTKIDRTSERVIKGKLPDIFCEVNELQDLRLIYEITLQEENKAWQDSKLDKVINYLLSLSCPCTHE